MTFLLASNNKEKLAELRAILSELGFNVISKRRRALTWRSRKRVRHFTTMRF